MTVFRHHLGLVVLPLVLVFTCMPALIGAESRRFDDLLAGQPIDSAVLRAVGDAIGTELIRRIGEGQASDAAVGAIYSELVDALLPRLDGMDPALLPKVAQLMRDAPEALVQERGLRRQLVEAAWSGADSPQAGVTAWSLSEKLLPNEKGLIKRNGLSPTHARAVVRELDALRVARALELLDMDPGSAGYDALMRAVRPSDWPTPEREHDAVADILTRCFDHPDGVRHPRVAWRLAATFGMTGPVGQRSIDYLVADSDWAEVHGPAAFAAIARIGSEAQQTVAWRWLVDGRLEDWHHAGLEFLLQVPPPPELRPDLIAQAITALERPEEPHGIQFLWQAMECHRSLLAPSVTPAEQKRLLDVLRDGGAPRALAAWWMLVVLSERDFTSEVAVGGGMLLAQRRAELAQAKAIGLRAWDWGNAVLALALSRQKGVVLPPLGDEPAGRMEAMARELVAVRAHLGADAVASIRLAAAAAKAEPLAWISAPASAAPYRVALRRWLRRGDGGGNIDPTLTDWRLHRNESPAVDILVAAGLTGALNQRALGILKQMAEVGTVELAADQRPAVRDLIESARDEAPRRRLRGTGPLDPAQDDGAATCYELAALAWWWLGEGGLALKLVGDTRAVWGDGPHWDLGTTIALAADPDGDLIGSYEMSLEDVDPIERALPAWFLARGRGRPDPVPPAWSRIMEHPDAAALIAYAVPAAVEAGTPIWIGPSMAAVQGGPERGRLICLLAGFADLADRYP